MPNEPLADPRLEAARKILSVWFDDPDYSPMTHPNDDLQMLSVAIRETKAAQLAEALEALITLHERMCRSEGISHKEVWDTFASASAVLASFKELTNGN